MTELVERGLLREESRGRGSEFLREYRRIEKFAEAFGIEL